MWANGKLEKKVTSKDLFNNLPPRVGSKYQLRGLWRQNFAKMRRITIKQREDVKYLMRDFFLFFIMKKSKKNSLIIKPIQTVLESVRIIDSFTILFLKMLFSKYL